MIRATFARAVVFVALALCLAMPAARVSAAGVSAAAPQPNAIPSKWEFDFRPGPLRIAHFRRADGTIDRYFYLTYRITNFSGEDLLFAPDVRLWTDDGDIHRAGRNVPRSVTDEILRRLDDPFLEDQVSIVGTVLQGRANAKEGLLVWPATNLTTDEVRLFFAGLSGETKVYVVGRESDDPKRHVLRKTRMLRYATPGVFGSENNEELELAEDAWVMR